MDAMQNLPTWIIYLMGGSFVLGSLFTLLILLALDFMRREGIQDSKRP